MKVYLIGAGPGDPELITVKASRIIGMCDTVVYDDLIPRQILALAPADAQKIYVGKRGGREYMKQPQINDLLAELAQEGHVVARLKGGDPCIFGRGSEEALFLKQKNIPFEFIPGITSAIAGPVSAGIPPTHRGYAASVTFVTAHEDPSKRSGFLNWNHLARQSGTIVFLMGARRIGSIAERLISEGMSPSTPCAMVQDATIPGQRHIISTLATAGIDAQEHKIGSPCVMVVGKVANLSKDLYAKPSNDLSGRSILITRPGHLAYRSAALFNAQGARAVIYPLIDISKLDFTLPDIPSYDMYIFTSQNAVPLFIDSMFAGGIDARIFAGKEIYCIGPKTRDTLKTYGIIPDGMAREFRAEGIFEMLASRDLKGKRICIPRAKSAREYLVNALAEKGAEVSVIPVYETILPRDATPTGLKAAIDETDTVLFTSPSGAKNAMHLLDNDPHILKEKRLVAIGPVTAKAMDNLGLSPDMVAKEYTDEGIISMLKGEEN